MQAKLSAFLFSLMLLASGTAHSTNLLEVLDIALSYDSSLKATSLRSKSGELIPEITRSSIYPTISSELGFKQQYMVQPSPRNESTLDLTIRQPLFSPVLDAGLEHANARSELEKLRLESAEQNLLLRVAERYFGILSAEDSLKTAESEVAAINKQLQLATERLKVGLGTTTEVYEAEARYSLAVSQEFQAQSAIQSARLALTEITGVEFKSLARLFEETPTDKPNPASIKWWVDTAVENNSEIALQRKTARISELAIDLEDARDAPSINLSATNKLFVSGSNSGRGNTTISLTMTLPLYQGNIVEKQVRQASLNHQAQVEVLNSLIHQTSSRTATAYLDVIRNINQVEALKAAVVASESALRAKEEGFSVGIYTTQDVLDAQRDRFRAIRDLQRARYDYILSLVRLENIAGTLDRGDLEQLNHMLR